MRWRIVVPVVVVVMLGGAGALWYELSRTHPVSVSAALERFRAEQKVAGPELHGVPAAGVYVYATSGSERLSPAGLSHRYPARTTLTVVAAGCGIRVRWDALDTRWMQWQLCPSAQGWRLVSYTDMHGFLTVADRRDYTCAAASRPSTGHRDLTCTAPDATVDMSLTVVGDGTINIAGRSYVATQWHLAQSATGKSRNEGTAELWLDRSGLPLRVTIANHGSQTVLGSVTRYTEVASLLLTSATPMR